MSPPTPPPAEPGLRPDATPLRESRIDTLVRWVRAAPGASFEAFETLLTASPAESARIERELTTLPRRFGWITLAVGVGIGAGTAISDPTSLGLDAARTPIPVVFVTAALVVQTVRQLLIVNDLHRRATDLDLFHLEPAHAFGVLTARAGAGRLVFIAFNVLLREATGEAGAPTSVMVVAGGLAIAVFTLPLLGLRTRLKAEKARWLGRTDDVGGLNTALNALITTRTLIAGISTWPWETETVRSFASTLLLPIFLWLVTRLLGRLV